MNIQDVPDELVEQIVKIRNSPEYHHHFTYNKTNSLKSRQLWQSLIQTLNLPWSVYDLNSKYKNLMRTYKKNIIIARTSGEHNIKWRFWDIMKKYVKFDKDDMYHTIINIDDDQSVMKLNGNDITNEISGLRHNIDVLNGEIERYIMGMEIEESVDEREMLKRLVKDVDEIKKCMKMVMQKLSKM